MNGGWTYWPRASLVVNTPLVFVSFFLSVLLAENLPQAVLVGVALGAVGWVATDAVTYELHRRAGDGGDV